MKRIQKIRDRGELPIMVIFEGGSTEEEASYVERYYSNYYYDKGYDIVNHSSRKPLLRTHLKRAIGSVIDALF